MKKTQLLIALLVFTILGCKNNIETSYPTIEPITESVYASGVIKSKNQYNIYSTVNGIIEKWFVNEGDTISIGDPLLIIANKASRLNAENAELTALFNDYKANESKLQDLKLSADFADQKLKNDSLLYIRQKTLWNNQIGSQVDFEQRQLAYENSKTAYQSVLLKYLDLKKQLSFSSQQSKKNLQLSQQLEGDYTIRSEINGRLYSKLREKGEIATAQIPLGILGDAHNFVIELQVDEYDIVRIKQNQQVWVVLDSYKSNTYEAKITKIYPMMNDRTNSFLVEASFIQPPPILYPNLTNEANIVIEHKEKALTLPRSYVRDDGFVFKKNGDSIKVITGLKDYHKIEIISGITATDLLRKL